MANTCFTTWLMTGPKEDLEKIHNEIKKQQKAELDALRGLTRLEFCSLYTILKNLGIDAPDEGVDYRMEFLNAEPEADFEGATPWLKFNSEDAWAPKTEAMGLLKKAFPKVCMFYTCEESGNEVFYTNDKNAEHFTDKYIVDSAIPGDESHYEYFDSEQAFVDWVNGTFNDLLQQHTSKTVHVESIDDASDVEELMDELMEEVDDEDCYFYLHKVQVDESDLWLAEEAA